MIRIRESALDALNEHAVRAYLEEACGILLGSIDLADKIVHAAVRIENRAASATRYLMSPSDFRWAEKYADQKRLTLVGIYHSHPDHPALASERDRVEALPFFSYVIVSVVGAEPVQTRSFVLSDDRSEFIEEPVELLESGSQLRRHDERRGVMTCP